MSQQFNEEGDYCIGMASLRVAYHSMNKFMYNWDCLLLPLPHNSYLVAKALFLNNHDINIIYKSYLNMWNLDKSINYVPVNILISRVGRSYSHLLLKFFTTREMSYENYFIFICIFIFYDLSHVALLLLFMANIFTSEYIKVEEISEFFSNYEISYNLIDACAILGIEKQKDSECPLDSYLLTDFIVYLNRCKGFLNFLEDFRSKLINISMNRGLYESIVIKCNYFYSNPSCVSYPTESCVSFINRKINGLPKPYYSEYGTSDPPVLSLSEVISILRQRFLNIYEKKKEKEESYTSTRSPIISPQDLNRMIVLSSNDKPVCKSRRNSLQYSNVTKKTPNINHRESVKSLEQLNSKKTNSTLQSVKSNRPSIQVLPAHENK